MPVMRASKTGHEFFLVEYDATGAEVPESGGPISDLVVAALTDGGDATDVFVASHGWQWDQATAQSHYGSWVDEMIMQGREGGAIARASASNPRHKAVSVVVHWPSLPFGHEPAAGGQAAGQDPSGDSFNGPFATEASLDRGILVDRYARRIADTDAARDALQRILGAADGLAKPGGPRRLRDGDLPAGLEQAYQDLYAESRLRSEGRMGAPGSDHGRFVPAAVMRDWADEQLSHAVQMEPPVPLRLLTEVAHEIEARWHDLIRDLEGDAARVTDLLLAPVRVLSFWEMKNRARMTGETGVNTLLHRIRAAVPRVRFHLMGHSFGGIVISAAISGPIAAGEMRSPLARPVSSVFLVQASMSLWSYAEEVSFGTDEPNETGFYWPVLRSGLIAGPLVTTRSRYDMANGSFFPIGTSLGSPDIAPDAGAGRKAGSRADRPEYGAVGTFGLRRTRPETTRDLTVSRQHAHHPLPDYKLRPGHVYNADARRVIRHGPWPEGAHNDIVHREIAELFWQAALAGMGVPA